MAAVINVLSRYSDEGSSHLPTPSSSSTARGCSLCRSRAILLMTALTLTILLAVGLALGLALPRSTHAASSPLAAVIADPALLIHTECGEAQGAWIEVPPAGESLPSSNSTRVASWLSLPFAAAPLADLRWAAPAPAECWPNGTVYDATNFKAFCIQPDGSGDEDCLFLHVYVPESLMQRQAKQRQMGLAVTPSPVWFYIHGGGLTGGSGNFEPVAPFAAHAGTGDEDEGLIIVTINYRLNIFGFLALDELSAVAGPGTPAANFGLLDQQAALKWVQRNIVQFGGDPARVTLGGQSSGGTSIFGLYSSPASRGLFRAAIALSGSINTSMTLEQGQVQNAGIPAAAGCGSGSAQNVVACLRAASVTTLVNSIPDCWNTPALFGIADLVPSGREFCGLIMIDGVSVVMGFGEALVAGLVDAPIILGNMGQENDLAPGVDMSNFTQAQFGQAMEQAVEGFNLTTMAQTLIQIYDDQATTPPEKAQADFNSDYGLTCGSVQLALAAKQGNFSSSFYLFVNQWAPEFPWPAGDRVDAYAFHTLDYRTAIESWPDAPFVPAASDLAHSSFLQEAWYTFIATGSLNSSSSGWRSVEQATGFPQHYATMVIQPNEPAMVVDYRADVCNTLAGFGFGQEFWWCD